MAGMAAEEHEARIVPCQYEDEDGLRKMLITRLEAALGPTCGTDSDGFEYMSIAHMWEVEASRKSLAVNSAESAWYHDALSYWDQCPPTVDGVLGGFGRLSEEDVNGSTTFINDLRLARPELERGCAIDCGAGIGRVTKQLLLPLFDEVHLLEQSPPLIKQAPEYLGSEGAKRVKCICCGMQAFEPEPGTYDVIWIQWVIGHLTDADLVTFFRRCTRALRRGGLICVKDNCFASERREDGTLELFTVDRDDSSVARSVEYFEALFEISDLEIVSKRRQEKFPTELFPVFMFALSPKL